MLSVPFLSASYNIYEYVEEHGAQHQSVSSTLSSSIILWRLKLFSSFVSFSFFLKQLLIDHCRLSCEYLVFVRPSDRRCHYHFLAIQADCISRNVSSSLRLQRTVWYVRHNCPLQKPFWLFPGIAYTYFFLPLPFIIVSNNFYGPETKLIGC